MPTAIPIRKRKSAPELQPADGTFDLIRAIEQHKSLLTVVEVAAYLGCTRKAVYGMIKRGGIPTCFLPGTNRLRINPVDYSRVLRLHNRAMQVSR